MIVSRSVTVYASHYLSSLGIDWAARQKGNGTPERDVPLQGEQEPDRPQTCENIGFLWHKTMKEPSTPRRNRHHRRNRRGIYDARW